LTTRAGSGWTMASATFLFFLFFKSIVLGPKLEVMLSIGGAEWNKKIK